MLNDEILEIVRMRPIDHLVSIIALNNQNINNISFNSIQNPENNQVSLFESFILNYGFIETSEMLFYIMINKSCTFYSKINQIVRNNLVNDLNEEMNPKGYIEIKILSGFCRQIRVFDLQLVKANKAIQREFYNE
jgi:hypothetical protein